MSTRISGAGLGAPYPQYAYPAELINNGIAYSASTNRFVLQAGDVYTIPPGDWIFSGDGFALVQFYDPITTSWRGFSNLLASGTHQYIRSDGQSWRVANLTGCCAAAVVTNAGSGYTSAPTVASSIGGSTWTAIVGGAIGTSPSIGTAGSGYTFPPILLVDGPPAGGIPAQMYGTLTSGTLTGVTVTDVGAGYTTAPSVTVLPNPADPNIASITPATVTTTISGSAGKVTALTCTYHGSPQATVPTLTFSGGGGTGAAATVVNLYTITSISASGGANFTDGQNYVVSVGGRTSATVASGYANPSTNLTNYNSRMLTGVPTAAAGAVTGVTIYDGGLYSCSNVSSNLPTVLILAQTGGTDPSGALTITPTLGNTQAKFFLSPL